MLTALLHFDDGTEVEQPIGDGQTVPFRLQHIQDLKDDSTLRTFAYRVGQPAGEMVIHYDELPPRSKTIH